MDKNDGAALSVRSDALLGFPAYMKRLEQFMEAVAKEMGCLPGYGDPGPDGENAHIMRKIKALKSSKPNVGNHGTSGARPRAPLGTVDFIVLRSVFPIACKPPG
jgi:hypothetical protein